MIKLWIGKDDKYYTDRETVPGCTMCRKDFQFQTRCILILDLVYKKSKNTKSYLNALCYNCYKKYQQFGEECQTKVLMLVDKIPTGSKPVLLTSAGLKSRSDVSSFDIAKIDKLGGVTIDNTVYANRSSELTKLEYDKKKEEALEYCEEKDRELGMKEGLDVLDDIFKAKPAE